MFVQEDYFYRHLSAVFEWVLSVNLELFELSFAVEFCFFSSFMLSNLLGMRGEEKPLMMTVSWYKAARVQQGETSREDGLSFTSIQTVAGSWLEEHWIFFSALAEIIFLFYLWIFVHYPTLMILFAKPLIHFTIHFSSQKLYSQLVRQANKTYHIYHCTSRMSLLCRQNKQPEVSWTPYSYFSIVHL